MKLEMNVFTGVISGTSDDDNRGRQFTVQFSVDENGNYIVGDLLPYTPSFSELWKQSLKESKKR